jgi:hypothetical protein
MAPSGTPGGSKECGGGANVNHTLKRSSSGESFKIFRLATSTDSSKPSERYKLAGIW